MSDDYVLGIEKAGAIYGRVISEYVAENNKLRAENAKLRRLAKAAWGCVNRHVSCDECRMVCCGCTLQSAMRELGIEVDG